MINLKKAAEHRASEGRRRCFIRLVVVQRGNAFVKLPGGGRRRP